jgi:hypothetical protein
MQSWEKIGDQLLEVYERAAVAPFREAAVLAEEAQSRESALARWVMGLEQDMGTVVGPQAYLPADVQRALLALSSRRRTRGILFRALRVLYRLGRRRG